jgi:hypothetical protein
MPIRKRRVASPVILRWREELNTGPTASPETDPTNPWRPESAGAWVAAERENYRRLDEPGITDQDRLRRR